MQSTFRKTVSAGIATVMTMLSLPLAVVAQESPRLHLTPHGKVQEWNQQDHKWVDYHEGDAHEGQTLRCVGDAHLDGEVLNEGGPKHDVLKLHSCSAIRFVKLALSEGGNVLYAKGFGEIETGIPHERWSRDDFKIEYPVALEVVGRDVQEGGGGVDGWTKFETPTAREARLIVNSNNARLFPLAHLSGVVTSMSAQSGTFTIREAVGGREEVVTCRAWSQVAKSCLGMRVNDETPVQMVQELHVGDEVHVYGVATPGRGNSSLPGGGSGAFAQNDAINFIPNVIFPTGGQYIFGGEWVLSSPITPVFGQGSLVTGEGTLVMTAGDTLAQSLPGLHPINLACEVGDEFGVAGPPPNVVAAGGGIGWPLYVLVGIGAGLLIGHSTSNNVILQNATTILP